MNKVMQAGDYIALADIQGPNHLEAIREGVWAMGYNIAALYGLWYQSPKASHAVLVLDDEHDFIWRDEADGRRWHPDEVTEFAQQGNGEKQQHCPTCGSPDPERHPAVQREGEVRICYDDFHWGCAGESESEEVLRELACNLSVGGYNADHVEPQVFKDKIMWGIDHLIDCERRRLESLHTQPRNTEAAAWIDEFSDRIDRGDERWWEDYETKNKLSQEWIKAHGPYSLIAALSDGDPIRRAERYVELGGVKFKAPETEAPEVGTTFYIPDHEDVDSYRSFKWRDIKSDIFWLENNQVHLDPKNASLHAQGEREAIRQQMGGGSDE